jgi:leucyl aminopeptidase
VTTPALNLVFSAPADLLNLSPARQEALRLQGFSGQLGQHGVLTDSGNEMFIGLGEDLNPTTIMRAIRTGLPHVPVGTEVVITGVDEPLRELVASAILQRGLIDIDAAPDAAIIADAVLRAQEWTQAPGAQLFPQAFADVARQVAAASDLSIDVLDSAELIAQGFGALTSVGAGSAYGPCLIDLRYTPKNATRRITLVGKGITFDTGGLSMKSPAAMMGMRMDKAGASAVLAVMSVLSKLQVPVEVRGLLAMAENMVGPQATRPGDVVIARNGTQIQIMDTDFEGRVVMADAIAYAGEEMPDVIIDIATLTYQVAIALGNDIAGLFSNDDALADALLQAAAHSGEPMWRMPIAEQYLDQVVTATGVKNHPESDVGRAITAALFLREFVPAGVAWAHLDCTGPAWIGKASDEGATGFGVRTLLDYVRRS